LSLLGFSLEILPSYLIQCQSFQPITKIKTLYHKIQHTKYNPKIIHIIHNEVHCVS